MNIYEEGKRKLSRQFAYTAKVIPLEETDTGRADPRVYLVKAK